MDTYPALAIPELLEAIFAFLSRKDLYRSCTRVNHQWNSVSMRIIQKKRKAEFIKIPGIRDEIIFYLYLNQRNRAEFINYCDVSKLWAKSLLYLRVKDLIFTSFKQDDDRFLISSRRDEFLRKTRVCRPSRSPSLFICKVHLHWVLNHVGFSQPKKIISDM